MKNLLKNLEMGLGFLAFAGIVLVAPAGIHIKNIAKNHYIKSFSERYYDGRVPKINDGTANERINLGNDLIYTGLGIGAAGIVGAVAINMYQKRKENLGEECI